MPIRTNYVDTMSFCFNLVCFFLHTKIKFIVILKLLYSKWSIIRFWFESFCLQFVSCISSVKLSWRKKFLLCMVCLLCIETWLIMFDSAHCTPSNNVAQYRVGYHWKLQTPPLWKNVFSSNRGRGQTLWP